MKRKEGEEDPAFQPKAKMLKTEITDKNKRYDRQLRLWGDHGQNALGTAAVCLLNATATGLEVLKCLVLPGIRKYTIVDSGNVREEDLGNNFFLEQSALGKPRAKCACRLLQELNTDVAGNFVVEDPLEIIEKDPLFFNQFCVVIASSLPESVMLKLSESLWIRNIALVISNAHGFLGYLRIIVKEHTVVEAHPDNALEDLRLDKPFPGLVSYMDSMDLNTMDKKDHGHTPFLVIIYKYLENWKVQHNNNWPKNYKEKKEFKSVIAQGAWKREDGMEELEENFEEAVKNVNNALVETKVPHSVQNILNDHKCDSPTEPNTTFWILSRAVKEFVNLTGALPLRGSLPDMFSDSDRYIQLQNVYKSKASEDLAAVYEFVQQILRDLQLGEDYITEEEIKVFCKNAHFINIIRGQCLTKEYDTTAASNSHKIGNYIGEDADSDAALYLVLRGLYRFLDENKRYPGTCEKEYENDLKMLKVITGQLSQELDLQTTVKEEFLEEICRCGAAELHTVAAIIGGIAAQEVIKIVTKQFLPLNNTFIYNAITETSVTMEL